MKKRNLVLFGTVATLSLALAGSLGAVTAFADTITGPSSSGTSTVTYTAESSWTIEIPDTITVGTAAQIEASNVNTVNGSLTITVNSENEFNLKDESGESEIPYELKVADAEEGLAEAEDLADNGTVLEVASGTASGNASIIGEVSGAPATGEDTYSDTLTFSVTVEDAA